MLARRLEWLDSIRGLAALAVLVEHYVGIRFDSYNKTGRYVLHFGYAAVVAFLLVSGYVIPLTLERSNDLRRFWRSRVFRLFPMYLITLGAAIALHLTGHPGVGDANFSDHIWKNSVVSLTMLQGVFHVPYALGVSWSLTVEMVFYLTMTLLFILSLHKRSVLLALIAAALIPLAAFSGLHVATELVVCYVTPFIGVLFYRMQTREISPAIAWCIFAVTIVSMAVIWAVQPGLRGDMAGAMSGYSFFAIVLAVPSIGNRYFAWLGKISYSVYLLHPFVVFGVPAASIKFPLLNHPWIALPGALVITILLAHLAYKYIETPMNELGKAKPHDEREFKDSLHENTALLASESNS